ncbi:uncharacterized protein CEXT_420711 [Caerostris extrusa]|uniref:Uncharacterized protein n=1 Tax=Caerostris extrusa TaxID=172846 RepID=A0AAV4SY44_CAEEX|nr:uncharacterized protein CEXT_420711 [Caerostris extrusa]
MKVWNWFTGAVVCLMFAHTLSYADKQRHLLSSRNFQDMGLPRSLPASVSYSVFLSALSGLQRTTHRKRTVDDIMDASKTVIDDTDDTILTLVGLDTICKTLVSILHILIYERDVWCRPYAKDTEASSSSCPSICS